MRKIIKMAALAAFVLGSSVAMSKPIGVSCTLTVTNPEWDDCAGAYEGNDTGAQGTGLDYLNTNNVFGDEGDWTLAGKDDGSETTSYFSLTGLGSTEGTLTFDISLQELAALGDIVLSFKAGNFYSMFFWNAPMGSTTVEWNTWGVSSTNLGYDENDNPINYGPQAMSHVSLFIRESTPNEVPEPATLALLGLGLMGLRLARKKA